MLFESWKRLAGTPSPTDITPARVQQLALLPMSAFGTENQAAKPLDARAKRRPRDLRLALTITIVACPYMPTVKPQRGEGI